jgi:hypothetical protein
MKRYIFILFLIITTGASAQKIQVNDTVFINVVEDKYSKDRALSESDKNYKVVTYFTGAFKDTRVVVLDSTQGYFSGFVKEFELNQDSIGRTETGGRYFYILSGKFKKNLIFLADGESIPIPFIRGYRILLINAHPSVVDGIAIMLYTFRYTNRFSVRY